MIQEMITSKLYNKILDSQNIFNAIFCMESYIFEKGFLDPKTQVAFCNEDGEVIEVIAQKDLE